jgi:hypothetical protein
MFKPDSKNGFSLKAYQGAQMTLLAMDLDAPPADGTFAGVTLAYKSPKGRDVKVMPNLLNFTGAPGLTPSTEAPIQTFKWVHFPGSYLQQIPAFGEYTYMATPRFFDTNRKLLPLDPNNTATVKIGVGDFSKGGMSVGFTRAFLKSQAFANRYGKNQALKPDKKIIPDWLFDTKLNAGKNSRGEDFSWNDMYFWLGYTARRQVYEMLDAALKDNKTEVEMYAYDLNDPGVAQKCLDLAEKGRIRIILDNAALHSTAKDAKEPSREDDFTERFNAVKKNGAEIFRCRFGRYSHCKIIILKKDKAPVKVLTGSTNFAVTGLCVNANHVVIFDRPDVAEFYSTVFNTCWGDGKAASFAASKFANSSKSFSGQGLPDTTIEFSPHEKTYAANLLDTITKHIQEKDIESVLFAVMEMGEKSSGNLIPALRNLHKNDSIYTYGVTDKSSGVISLYKPGRKNGLLIDAKAAKRDLPPPFREEASLGIGHAIHHKFIITNFNRPSGRVYCGSSNLALGGECQNGDNLLCIKDEDVATAFAIESIRLTDHYNFRSVSDDEVKPANQNTAVLDDTGKWVEKFFDPADIRCVERKVFA